jgi:hypothetical protein
MWSLVNAHGQPRTLTDVYGHTHAAARIRATFASGGPCVHSGCEPSRVAEGAGAECPGAPADEDRRPGEEPGNCASRRGVIPRQLAPSSGSGPATRCLRMQGQQWPPWETQCWGFAPVHDQGFHEESFVAWSHRKEHHHGRAAVPVGSAAWAGRPVRHCCCKAPSCPAVTRSAGAESGTSSPSRRFVPILGSVGVRSTNGGQRAGRPGASRCRTAVSAFAALSISAGWRRGRRPPDDGRDDLRRTGLPDRGLQRH